MMRINLPDVTLVGFDTVCHELTQMAMEECVRQVDFGDVKLFTNMPGQKWGLVFDELNDADSRFNFPFYKLPDYINTSHLLFVQWDAWVIDPEMWNADFLNYDYIGAPWWYTDGLNVGNNGFCLRSKALMQHIAAHPDKYPLRQPEDELLCRTYRPLLPQFKWAPEVVAQAFSFERARASISSRHFGFHGMFNWPFVLPPDRLDERMQLARANSYVQKSGMLKELDNICSMRWIKPIAGIHVGTKHAEEV